MCPFKANPYIFETKLDLRGECLPYILVRFIGWWLIVRPLPSLELLWWNPNLFRVGFWKFPWYWNTKPEMDAVSYIMRDPQDRLWWFPYLVTNFVSSLYGIHVQPARITLRWSEIFLSSLSILMCMVKLVDIRYNTLECSFWWKPGLFI